MNAVPVHLSLTLLICLYFTVANAYPTKSDPRLGPAHIYDYSHEDPDDDYSPPLRQTRQDGPAGGIVEMTPFFGQFDYADQNSRGQGPPITKKELERDLELLDETVRKAELEKGRPLTRKELQELEEKLEKKPWYRRFTTGISKFFKGIFGRRKRQPDFLGLSSKGPPITKEEIQRELELVEQDLEEAKLEKGGPLNKKDLERLEEKLEHEPWYGRLINGVSEFFLDDFGRRRKRVPDYLGLNY